MDTLSCTAEPKPSMMRLKNNRNGTTRSAAQFSLMIIIREEDLTLDLRIIRTSIGNPDTEIRTTRHSIDRLASTQIGTEIQIQIDSFIKIDRTTLGPTDPTTVSRLSITSMLDQKIQTLNTTKTFHRATTYLHPIQFNSSMTKIQI